MLMEWKDYEFKQFGLKRVKNGILMDKEEPWAAQVIADFAPAEKPAVALEEMKPKELRAHAGALQVRNAQLTLQVDLKQKDAMALTRA